ncbi:hypothetical protein [Xenorhabdus miraniensis]|uniref:Uncharacterized protein n=1 Tax=Xenorhabdus miraniensis TaxID=351674 RepID=A0A2D0JWF9_9GAMM|nr:hypothetical protein [Xenorhabdus miraniensis]PHM50722.1 hypothetical protein Xmir_00124 [Xenorhabdus miraniensis]
MNESAKINKYEIGSYILLCSDSYVDEQWKYDRYSLIDFIEEKIKDYDVKWVEVFLKCINVDEESYGSFLLNTEIDNELTILYLLHKIYLNSVEIEWLEESILNAVIAINPLITFDYRMLLAEFIIKKTKKKENIKSNLLNFIQKNKCISKLKRRKQYEKWKLATDGIDHIYPIPDNNDELDLIIYHASKNCTILNIITVIERVLFLSKAEMEPDAYYNNNVFENIKNDLTSCLLSPLDWIVSWDKEVVEFEGFNYSIAELLRILLLNGRYHIPDKRKRTLLLSFYRSVLRISSGAIIGLEAGVFHVEHGSLCSPSWYYMGRFSALGKGCKVDGVGGFAMLKGAFAGGGFIPILIHTHKHISSNGNTGIKERKVIKPCILEMKKYSRIPMSFIGIYEAVDYLEYDAPYNGLTSYSIR